MSATLKNVFFLYAQKQTSPPALDSKQLGYRLSRHVVNVSGNLTKALLISCHMLVIT